MTRTATAATGKRMSKPATAHQKARAPKKAQQAARAAEPPPAQAIVYPVPRTRLDARQLSGYFPTPDAVAFRALAATLDMDVQELLAEGVNAVFERHGLPNRVPVTSGRRTRRAG